MTQIKNNNFENKDLKKLMDIGLETILRIQRWPSFMNKDYKISILTGMITFYKTIEDYDSCGKLQTILDAVNNDKR